MAKFRIKAVFIPLALFFVFALHAPALAAYFDISYFEFVPASPYNEGDQVTIKGGGVYDGTIGNPLTGEVIVALYVPRSFTFNQPARIVTTLRPDYSNYMIEVTRGPAYDAAMESVAKMKSWPGTKDVLADLESRGTYSWKVLVGRYRDTVRQDDVVGIIGTMETGGVVTAEAAVLLGVTFSLINHEDPNQLNQYHGASCLNVINATTNQVSTGQPAGLSTGLIGNADISRTTGHIFTSAPFNFSTGGVNLGATIATNLISVFDENGVLLKDIYIPHVVTFDATTRADYSIYRVAWAPNLGGRLYGSFQSNPGWFEIGSKYTEIRIYDESGNEETYSPVRLTDDIGFKSGLALSVSRSFFAATAEASGNRIYAVCGGGGTDQILSFYDNGASPTFQYFPVPDDKAASSVTILGNGNIAVAAENYVYIFDNTGLVRATIECETSADGCEPVYAVDDPSAGVLYVAQSLLGSGKNIWKVNYSASPATCESKVTITAAAIGAFALAKVEGLTKLYVPYIPAEGSGGVAVVAASNMQVYNYFPIGGGLPVSAAFVQQGSSGKLFVSDFQAIQVSAITDLIALPPETTGHAVHAYVPSAGPQYNDLSGHVLLSNVGHLPFILGADANKVAVVGAAIPGAMVARKEVFGDDALTFFFTAAPTIENVCINGGLVRDGDLISSTPVLTADLNDNSGIWTAEVRVDGQKRTNMVFSPVLPANTSLGPVKLTLNIGELLASENPHSVTIEVSDGQGSAVWDVFFLMATSGESSRIQGDYPAVYPAVFKPLRGTADEKTLRIAYELSVDTPVTIVIVDITGRPVFTRKFGAASMGGRAGYNEVTWDGRMDTGGIIANGIYPYRIMRRDKVLAKGQIVVFE